MTIDFKQDILAPVASDFAAMDTFINEGITSNIQQGYARGTGSTV